MDYKPIISVDMITINPINIAKLGGDILDNKYYSELRNGQKEISLKSYLMRGGTYQFCWHKAIELMFVLQGEIEVYVEGELNTLKENDVLLINSNLGHSIFSKDVNSITLVIEISPDLFRECAFDYDTLEISCVSDSITRFNAIFSQIRFYMAQLMGYAMRKNKFDEISQKIHIQMLISEIVQNFAKNKLDYSQSKKSKNDFTALQSAMDFIDENFSNKISLEDVAGLAGYNRTYLSTLFKKKMGITFNEYVMRVRLKNAVDSLSNTKIAVLDTALNNGFSDSKTFIQYMKKYCGMTPEKYRKELTNNPTMNRLYGANRYVEYPNHEAEQRLIYFKQGIFCSANRQEPDFSKDIVIKEVEMHCNKILDIINDVF